MKFEKPIVFFDLESTGLDLINDRVVEISMIKINTDKSTEKFYSKINPEGREVGKQALSKHGLTNDELALEPTFKDLSETIHDFIKDCDLGGYNCWHFDIPLLIEEFLRASIPINTSEINIVDVYKLLMKAEPRTLESVYKRFMGKELENAHTAEADIIGTIAVLGKMNKEFNLPDTAEMLHKFTFADDNKVDFSGKLKKQGDQIVFAFGKHKNKSIDEVWNNDPNYFNWVLSTDMTRHTKIIFSNIVNYLQKKY